MTYKRILVPIDFGESSFQALDVAVDLSESFSASLTLLHSCEVPTAAVREQFEVALADLQKRLPGAKGILAEGTSWRRILGAIEETGADVVVMAEDGPVAGAAHTAVAAWRLLSSAA